MDGYLYILHDLNKGWNPPAKLVSGFIRSIFYAHTKYQKFFFSKQIL